MQAVIGKSLAKLGGADGKVCLILVSLRVDTASVDVFEEIQTLINFFSPAVQGRCLRAAVAFVPSQCSSASLSAVRGFLQGRIPAPESDSHFFYF